LGQLIKEKMNKSLYKIIKIRLLKYKRGRIIFPNNFKNLGNQESVKKALLRLQIKGVLVRLSHGIYLYPKRIKVWEYCILQSMT